MCVCMFVCYKNLINAFYNCLNLCFFYANASEFKTFGVVNTVFLFLKNVWYYSPVNFFVTYFESNKMFSANAKK